MKISDYSNNTFLFGRNLIIILFCSFCLSFQIFAAAGRLDFNFQNVLASGADVTAIEIQPDGKILAAGSFVTRGAVLRKDVVRLNADGSLDTTFNAGSGANNGTILVMKLQTDGKILVGGSFNNINGVFRTALARLNADGSVDMTFGISGINITFVFDLDLQSDGKILISAINSIGTSFVTRLNSDGSSDQTNGVPLFISSLGGFGYRVIFVPTENKILVGGRFSYTVNQTVYNNLARFNLDGTIDPTFTANVIAASGLSVNTELLGNGKILVWGKFDTVNGVTRRNIAVLNSDGSLDASFNPATNGAETILSLAVQPNGKIIIGGSNFNANSVVRGNVARLNADGTVDNTFNQRRGANAAVKAVKIQGSNNLLIGGTFFRYHLFPRSGLARINL